MQGTYSCKPRDLSAPRAAASPQGLTRARFAFPVAQCHYAESSLTVVNTMRSLLLLPRACLRHGTQDYNYRSVLVRTSSSSCLNELNFILRTLVLGATYWRPVSWRQIGRRNSDVLYGSCSMPRHSQHAMNEGLDVWYNL